MSSKGVQQVGFTGLADMEARIQAKYDEEDFVIGQVDYADIRSIETFVPTLKDLRPELFDNLKKMAEEL
jgi:hypothetical protein